MGEGDRAEVGPGEDVAREAGGEFGATGHRQIGLINKSRSFFMYNRDDLLKGYRLALEAAGIAFCPGLVREGNFTFEDGYANLRSLLARSMGNRSAVSLNKGLGRIQSGSGTFIAFATQPDAVAVVDRDGSTSGTPLKLLGTLMPASPSSGSGSRAHPSPHGRGRCRSGLHSLRGRSRTPRCRRK